MFPWFRWKFTSNALFVLFIELQVIKIVCAYIGTTGRLIA